MIFFHKFRRNLRDFGFRITVQKAAMYPLRWFYHAIDYRIYRINLADWKRTRPEESGNLHYRLISAMDREIIKQIEDMEEWLRGDVAPILQAGGICLAATEGGKMAGFNLVGFGYLFIPAVEKTRTFRPKTAWSVQISVSPEFRGQGVASELRYRIFAELKSRGILRFYGGAMTNNTASLKLASRVGFRDIADIKFRKCCNVRTWRYIKLKSPH